MRKRLLLLFWCLLLVISVADAARPGRGTAGVRQKATTSQTINPDTLYSASYALVIGASDYTNGWPKLPGVKTDVNEVAAVLQKLGFQVTTVLDPDKTALAKAFDDFIDQYGRVLDNRLLFYFAGHGYTAKKSYGEDMGYIVPVDAPNPLQDLDGFLKFGLDMQMIEVYAKRIEAKHALFIFDSCFSGSLFALSRAVPASITYKTAKPVRQFITSGSADEEVPDRSTFRGQFVAALDGEADKDGDGYVTGSELGMFLQNSVTNYSYGAQHPQYGTIRNPNLDKGDFVFQVVAVEPPSQPLTPMPPPPTETTFSIADLKAREDAERASRSEWGQRQTEMQAAFDEAAAFVGRAEFQREAWSRFLTAYAKNNPYSEEDERLRAAAQQRLAGIVDEPERKEFEPEMVDIPAGSFRMGSPSNETGRSDDEGPVHKVHIDAFQMGKYEVTRGQFRAFVDATSYKTTAEQGDSCYGWTGSTWEKKAEFNWLNMGFAQEDNHPVACVSWDDAVAYTEWLARETGKPYRLPSEAEWEYAARAGTTTARFWGNDPDQACSYANVHDRTSKQQLNLSWTHHDCNDGHATTAPVGSYSPNPWGLYDMLGNVWEWNQDKWHGNYDSAPTDGTAWESGDSSGRLLRGCSWGVNPDYCRAANRNLSTYPYDSLGFRVVFRVAGRAF